MSHGNDLNDMSLVELFQLETKNQCLSLTENIHGMSSQVPEDIDLDAIQRSIHSIKGAARIINLKVVIELTKSMENILQHHSRDLLGNDELKKCFEECSQQLSSLARVSPDRLNKAISERSTNFKSLQKYLSSYRSLSVQKKSKGKNKTDKQSKTDNGFDNYELFKIFREDAENHLAILSDNLLEIEKDPHQYILLESSMRTVHSLKGAARVIELHQIVQLTHILEDLFIAAQERKLQLSNNHIDVIFTAVDFIKTLIQLNENTIAQWLQDNADSLTTIIDNLSSFITASSHSVSDNEIGAQATNDSINRFSSTTDDSTFPEKDRTLRVSSQSIGKMMGMAGEAMIESRWLPQHSNQLNRLRRLQTDVWQTIERAKKHILDSKPDPYIENSFNSIARKLGLCSQYLSSQISDVDEHSIKSINIFHRLHREIVNNRMQPLSEGLSALPRLIRDLSRKQGKEVRFEVIGSGTLIDRDILEKIESPLNHIITNAIDHGIELPKERSSIRKEPQATIRIEAKHMSGMLHITISDDGRGINFEDVRSKIVEKKLVSPTIAAELTEYELQEFLFLPSFTTKSEPTKTSGRGVGLDVVHNSIRDIRGSVQVFSVLNKGTYFELRLPLTLSIIRGMIASINNEPYSFPLVNINHVLQLHRNEIKEIGERQYFISNNKRVGLISSQQVLDLPESKISNEFLSVIVLDSVQNTYGLIVDSFNGIKDLVVQPLNPGLGKLKSISAAAIADDGTPILILDVSDILHTMDRLISGERLKKIDATIHQKLTSPTKRILVVDDSVTVREVERKILIDHGFTVEVAVDGLDAWDKIKQFHFDLIVTDIDMPNMDGIELVGQVKDSPGLVNIPIIIVSYKDTEEDKNRGLDAGADYYLTKANFHNQTLIDATEDLIGSPYEDT